MFSTGFSMKPQSIAEEENGPTLNWLQEISVRENAALSGSVIIKEGDHYFNRLFFVFPDGSYQTYDKRHLFSLAGEEKVYHPGKDKLIVEYGGWRINPQICYDLRFPVWCRNSEDFDLQFFVANWPERRAEPWSALLKARAIENQAYVAGLNRIGEDGNGVYHSGHSAVHDPLGEMVSQTKPHEESLEIIELDLDHIKAIRQKFGFLKDRDQFDIQL